jgi:hypothetical protein
MTDVLHLAANDLLSFCIARSPLFETPPHIKFIAEKLEAILRGENKRLMVFLPPRHGKSYLTTTLFPAYFLGHRPSDYVVVASYSNDLAQDFGRAIRNLIADPMHQAIFPKCQLAPDSQGIEKFSTTAGGRRLFRRPWRRPDGTRSIAAMPGRFAKGPRGSRL